MNEEIRATLLIMPTSPGCYQFLDKDDKVIYVGKAKNLKRRVSSYFNKTIHDPKTRIMLKKVVQLRYIVVNTEEDALILENNLIKTLQPRYNILLKDDKTYLSIVIKNEPFPRIMATRNIIRDGSSYYGPFPSSSNVKGLIELLRRLYKFRNCRLALTEERIREHQFNVCLQYQIKMCNAPCVGLQTSEDYAEKIKKAVEILRGDVGSIIRETIKKMNHLAEEMRFEEAQELKEQCQLLESFRIKTTVTSSILHDVDVFGVYESENSMYINYLQLKKGRICGAHTFEIKKRIAEAPEALLSLAIIEMRERYESTAKEILLPFLPDSEIEGLKYIVAQKGERKHILKLSERNARQFLIDQEKRSSKNIFERKNMETLEELKKKLHMKELPKHIECFDNSNIQGSFPVAACVVFKNGVPSKKDYRHFNVKTVEGPNDFDSMREIIYRRYTRLLDEHQSLPQLIVIDGGKGQLSAAVDSLKALNIYGKVTIIGLAKRLEEVFFPGDSEALYLDKDSNALKLLQHLRDEAHRFGITFHRNKRSKGQVHSSLDEIPGIGEKTAQLLLKHYKSYKRIKEAQKKDLQELLGERRGEKIFLELQKAKS